MEYRDFLETVKIVRMFKGLREAEKFFNNNIELFPHIEYNLTTTKAQTKKKAS